MIRYDDYSDSIYDSADDAKRMQQPVLTPEEIQAERDNYYRYHFYLHLMMPYSSVTNSLIGNGEWIPQDERKTLQEQREDIRRFLEESRAFTEDIEKWLESRKEKYHEQH